MIITFYRVNLAIEYTNMEIDISTWYPILANIYGIPGLNYDGYISLVEKSDTNDSLKINCYTVEGPEEKIRLDSLKNTNDDWPLYRKSAVTSAIIRYALHIGYKIKGYTVEVY